MVTNKILTTIGIKGDTVSPIGPSGIKRNQAVNTIISLYFLEQSCQ